MHGLKPICKNQSISNNIIIIIGIIYIYRVTHSNYPEFLTSGIPTGPPKPQFKQDLSNVENQLDNEDMAGRQ